MAYTERFKQIEPFVGKMQRRDTRNTRMRVRGR